MTKLQRSITTRLEPVGKRGWRGIGATSALLPDGVALVMNGCDLSRVKNGICLVLENHDVSRIIAKVIDGWTTGDSFYIEAEHPPAGVSSDSDRVLGLIKAGTCGGLSIGIDVIEAEPIDPNRPRQGLRATRWAPLEVSVASVPLDPAARITERSYRPRSEERAGGLGALARALGGALEPDPYTYRRRQEDLRRLIRAGDEIEQATELSGAPIWTGDSVRFAHEMAAFYLRRGR